MLRERIAEDVSFFSSDQYAQVCAGVIGTPDGAILIDTLALPSETREIRDFVEQRLNAPVRFVINTHHLSEQIENHIQGNRYQIPVFTRNEPEILGTGGAIKNMADFFVLGKSLTALVGQFQHLLPSVSHSFSLGFFTQIN